jgi:hypothetical protein
MYHQQLAVAHKKKKISSASNMLLAGESSGKNFAAMPQASVIIMAP